MRRGAKPAKAKGETKRPVPRKSGKGEGSRVGDLEKRLAETLRDKAEALEQQTATADILRVISRSPSDIQPVFDAIVQNAVKLCAGLFGTVLRLDGDRLHLAAHHNLSPAGLQAYREHYPVVVDLRETVASGAILGRRVVQVIDSNDPGVPPRSVAMARATGFRGVVVVPMLRDGEPIGVINVARQERGPFAERQVALLQTFADQAVIAIENVRLFKELQEKNGALTQAHRQVTEALDQQTATSEVLRVIAGSPTDLQPVLDALVESASRLCQAADTFLLLVEGDQLRLAAMHGSVEESARLSNVIHRGWVAGRAVMDAQTVHVEDLANAESEFPLGAQIAVRFGHRTALAMPLFGKGVPIGALFLRRREVRPFSTKEIALLQSFADQAVIAIENARLFKELEVRNTDLTEALEQQTATSEILRAISGSPTDAQPVLDIIALNATRVCGARDGAVLLKDGTDLYPAAHHGPIDMSVVGTQSRIPIGRDWVSGRSLLDRRAIQVEDLLAAGDEYPRGLELARANGHRTTLATPLLREGEPMGVLLIRRGEVRPFTLKQMSLLEMFAAQAVIAIENVRLFNETKEALEQQTATSEILRVISQSQTDVQPVFDTIAANARRLCNASSSAVFTFDGELIHLAAQEHMSPQGAAVARGAFPMPPGRGSTAARAIMTRSIAQITEAREDPEYVLRDATEIINFRSVLAVPMLRGGHPIGAVSVGKAATGPFPDKQIALLQTFADQAVIAIENVRLFKELGARNRALTDAHTQMSEALEQQTATSEILQVISASPTDLRPVFETILRSAVHLCAGSYSLLFLCSGEQLDLTATHNVTPEGFEALKGRYPLSIASEEAGFSARAVRERRLQHVADIQNEPRIPAAARRASEAVGQRAAVAVPLLREGEPVGVLTVSRQEPRAFSENEITLLQTFADQAVIAIENVRLFKELEARTAALTRSVGQLTALAEVGRAVSSTLDLETVLTTIVSRAVELSGLDGGVVLEYDEDAQEFVHRAQAETGGTLAAARRATRIRRGEGVVGRAAVTLEPVQVFDITAPGAYVGPNRENLFESGIRAILAVPMVREGKLIGCLGVTRNRPGEFPAEVVELLKTFATQSALAIQNARLFREIEEKSRQLGAASHHKSEFLANMSHELRTPLNAVIGFSEVLLQRMFGELNAKQDEYLQDIYASGQHLLSLINDILDLSKIEAGRMELELTDFDLPTALDSALTLIRERAGRRGIALHLSVDERLGPMRADERKIRQVVLNLLSNAIKFTPEGGRVDVAAVPRDEFVEVSVSDTGVGIAPEDQEAVFEEFRQVGTAAKKVEGTGLGLALSRKFIELHGGRIWVQSQVGIGSTFTFSIPVRRRE